MTAWIIKVKNSLILFPLILLMLNSCTLVQQPFDFNQQLKDYAEALYKRQNQATQSLMVILEETLSIEDEEQLSDAELKMYDACHLLNEIVAYEVEGRFISLDFKRRVRNSFPDCEQSILDVELLIIRYQD